ncbi:hypothetical protein PGT21_006846 [Puccinia graminis f. sp. tritici]|uniref:Uncharacterized protein n=1 Tax=Puccinia graminis f. sp. tritici TaxID=56615 RepID=A0A5B0PWZ0_PUCGR|nr:hypothetical protein PGTUg99_027683 [Puccinia graminis f. sp. tritici]KAA1105422.1 hypothetical protein PGT21_006846 [Puccinia graminis f. sp. tritici]
MSLKTYGLKDVPGCSLCGISGKFKADCALIHSVTSRVTGPLLLGKPAGGLVVEFGSWAAPDGQPHYRSGAIATVGSQTDHGFTPGSLVGLIPAGWLNVVKLA